MVTSRCSSGPVMSGGLAGVTAAGAAVNVIVMITTLGGNRIPGKVQFDAC